MREPVDSPGREATLPVTSPMVEMCRWRRVFPGCKQELRQLRTWLSWLLPECLARNDVLSVATELGSNALEHTASGEPGGSFAVEVVWHESVVQVAIADGGGPGEPEMICDPDGERGRGLLLVHGLSVRAGWTGDQHGRLVWAQIAWPDWAPAVLGSAGDPRQTVIRETDATLARFEAVDHPPARCCCHVFTAACPIDCLAALLGTATFHALARAERAPFDPPATVRQVLCLWRSGQLGLAAGLGPRRLGEIEAALVLAGLALRDPEPPGDGLSAVPGCGILPAKTSRTLLGHQAIRCVNRDIP